MINTHAGPSPLATWTAGVAASPTSNRFAINDFLQPEWAILPVLIIVIVVGAAAQFRIPIIRQHLWRDAAGQRAWRAHDGPDPRV